LTVYKVEDLFKIGVQVGLQLGMRKHYDKEFKAKVAIEA
jgi:hypothetical protein